MINTKHTDRALRKRKRTALERTAAWLSHQLLLKDGGLATTARGIAAAALLAIVARSTPATVHLVRDNWAILVLPVATALGATVVMTVIERRRHRHPAGETPKVLAPPAQRNPEEHFDVHVHIEIRHTERRD